MTGVQTVQDIYDEATNHERTHVGLLGTDIYASHRTETYSAMLSRPPVLLDPRQGDVGGSSTVPVEDAPADHHPVTSSHRTPPPKFRQAAVAFPPRCRSGLSAQGGGLSGERIMAGLTIDIVLMSAFVTGIVIVAANFLL
jgi:hypothetical protein